MIFKNVIHWFMYKCYIQVFPPAQLYVPRGLISAVPLNCRKPLVAGRLIYLAFGLRCGIVSCSQILCSFIKVFSFLIDFVLFAKNLFVIVSYCCGKISKGLLCLILWLNVH